MAMQWTLQVFELATLLLLLSSSTVKAEAVYLPFLDLNSVESSGRSKVLRLDHCDDCYTRPISIEPGFPFANRTHDKVYINSNGIISFGQPFPAYYSIPFPILNSIYGNSTFYYYYYYYYDYFYDYFFFGDDYLVAPFWGDHHLGVTRIGHLQYAVFNSTDKSDPSVSAIFEKVDAYINYRTNNSTAGGGNQFSGQWMLVAFWDRVPAYAHTYLAYDLYKPDKVLTNTYQAVLVTDGLVSHTVFIYRCGWMDWGDFAVIGFDAGGEFYANHELSLSLYDNRVACANMPDSEWSNVWYQLNPTDAAIDLPDMPIPNTNIPPPDPSISRGSCVEAGFTTCCDNTTVSCFGSKQTCFCDEHCYSNHDCCFDVEETCTATGTCSKYKDCTCDNYLCLGSPPICYCNPDCAVLGNCCPDVEYGCATDQPESNVGVIVGASVGAVVFIILVLVAVAVVATVLVLVLKARDRNRSSGSDDVAKSDIGSAPPINTGIMRYGKLEEELEMTK